MSGPPLRLCLGFALACGIVSRPAGAAGGAPPHEVGGRLPPLSGAPSPGLGDEDLEVQPLGVAGEPLPRFSRVAAGVFRSGQPSREGLAFAAGLGVRTVLNLRYFVERGEGSEEGVSRRLGMDWLHVPMKGFKLPSYGEVDRALAILADPARQPVLVHCAHGKDRTGAVVAGYRVVHEGMTVGEAAAEARRHGCCARVFLPLEAWLEGYRRRGGPPGGGEGPRAALSLEEPSSRIGEASRRLERLDADALFDGSAGRSGVQAPVAAAPRGARAHESLPPGPPPPPSGGARIGDSTVRVLSTEREFLSASLELIAGARESIDVEMFGFHNERLIGALEAAMAQKARAGVRVRIVLDPLLGVSLWEWRHKREVVARLRKAGAEVVFYPTRRLGRYKIDHVKLLVADGGRAVAGGTNWDADLGRTRDFNLRLEGGVAGRLAEVFEEAWAETHDRPAPPRSPQSGDPAAQVQVLLTGHGRREVLEAALRRIASARESIRAAQFLLNEPAVLEALIKAHRRGVRVRLLLDTNDVVLGGVNALTAERLDAAGVPVRYFSDPSGSKTLLHAKLAVFDGETVLIGSANWSKNSLRANRELAFLFSERSSAGALSAAFDEDWRLSSKPVTRVRGLSSVARRLIAWLAGLVS